MSNMEPQTRRDLRKQARKLDRARATESEAWDELRAMMKKAHDEEGWTFSEIGDIVGVTKARVYQIVTGNRGGKKKPDDSLTRENAESKELATVGSGQ